MLSKGKKFQVLDFKLKEKEQKSRFVFDPEKMILVDTVGGVYYQLVYNRDCLWGESADTKQMIELEAYLIDEKKGA